MGFQVPFGKAAFFPGRLIHTNEFLVLLGEGYYADRTSKQTVEILTRRGKSLDSQVDSLEAIIKDLRAEASFFNATASEALVGFNLHFHFLFYHYNHCFGLSLKVSVCFCGCFDF